MQSSKTTQKVSGKKRGNALGFWFFRTFLRIAGLRGVYGFLYPVCLHYLLFDQEAVGRALAYVTRRFPGSGFFGARLHVYRLFICQGKQLIDRYAAVSGYSRFDFSIVGLDQLSKLLGERKEGFILLTAHFGNWQIALTALKNLNRKVHLLMRPEDNPALERSLSISRENDFVKIISVGSDFDGVIEIMKALKQGDVVSIMGDRKYNFDALGVSFLGEQAYLPYGAFAIAAASGSPVVILLSAKISFKKYLVDVANVLYPRYNGNTAKKEQLRGFLQEFADVLQAYTRQYPYQCFLFHDIWKNKEE